MTEDVNYTSPFTHSTALCLCGTSNRKVTVNSRTSLSKSPKARQSRMGPKRVRIPMAINSRIAYCSRGCLGAGISNTPGNFGPRPGCSARNHESLSRTPLIPLVIWLLLLLKYVEICEVRTTTAISDCLSDSVCIGYLHTAHDVAHEPASPKLQGLFSASTSRWEPNGVALRMTIQKATLVNAYN